MLMLWIWDLYEIWSIRFLYCIYGVDSIGVNGEGGIFIVEVVFWGYELLMIYILFGVWYVSILFWGV